MRIFLGVFFLIFFYNSIAAQATYWVQLKPQYRTQTHLALSPESLYRRQKNGIVPDLLDFALPLEITEFISRLSPNALYSRWQFGAIAALDSPDILLLKKQKWVESVHKIYSPIRQKSTSQKMDSLYSTQFYGQSIGQIKMMGLDSLHRSGFRGQGVRIAIFDAGFIGVDSLKCFSHLFAQNRIFPIKNFPTSENLYSLDHHGTAALGCMAAYIPDTIVGAAPMAEYFLFITEDPRSEQKIEEYYWMLAAEMADSIGIDIINSSLGYTTFDNPADNYTPSQMDGKTAIVSKAATIASQKGILVINSAGNAGDKEWRIISAPADVPDVISVGGVDSSRQVVGFSSRGVWGSKWIKPSVCAQAANTLCYWENGRGVASNGTSFSAPLISGTVASIYSAFPQKTALEIKEILYRSAHKFASPDIHFGMGIPNLISIFGLDSLAEIKVFPIPTSDFVLVDLPKNWVGAEILLYHFSDRISPIFKKYSETASNYYLSLSDFPTGLYWLQLKNQNGETVWRKILKK